MRRYLNKYMGFGGKMKYNEAGEEIPDPSRPEIPLGFKKPESLAEQVRRLIRSEQLRAAATRSGHETFEEADDFNVGDDFDPRSPYEEIFDPTTDPAELGVTQPGPSPKESAPDPKGSKKDRPKRAKPAEASQGSGDESPQEED